MKLFQKAIQILQKPFPEDSRSVYYRNLTFLSVFVTLFLYIFQPFGISTLTSKKFLICLGFGSMTFLGASIFKILLHYTFKHKKQQEKWTFGKWILNNLCIMVIISLTNFLFARLLLIGHIDWSLFPQMIYSTFMIGILPLIIIGGWSLLKNERKYQSIADEINHSKNTIPKSNEAENHSVFEIPTYQIRYIEALQNYTKIGFVNSQGSLEVKTERSTLKRILTETEGTSIIKCHRSYLVNKDAIISTTGNAQGLLLSLSDCDKIIPVSRTRVSYFRNN